MKDISAKSTQFYLNLMLEYAFLFFSLFPYLTPVYYGTDTQPWAAFLAGVIILTSFPEYRFPMPIYLLLYTALFSSMLLFFSSLDFMAFRSWFNYVSLFITSAAAYIVFRRNPDIIKKMIVFATYAWLSVALVQYFFDPRFMSFIVSRSSGSLTGGRGVVGLASEPTLCATVCLTLFILTYLVFGFKKKLVLFLLIFQAIFLSKSSTVFAIVALSFVFQLVYIFLKTLVNLMLIFFRSKIGVNKNVYLSLLFLLISFFTALYLVPANSRLWDVYAKFQQYSWRIFYVDRSVFERIIHPALTIYGFVTNFGLPHGFSAWPDFILATTDNLRVSYRIMSAYGAGLFELGAVGVLIPYCVTALFIRFHRRCVKNNVLMIFFLSAMTGILISSIPLATPHFGLIIGFLSYAVQFQTREAQSPAAVFAYHS